MDEWDLQVNTQVNLRWCDIAGRPSPSRAGPIELDRTDSSVVKV